MMVEMRILLASVVLLFVTTNHAAIQTKEQQLINILLDDYNRFARPILNDSQPTDVTFGAEIVQLIAVNDRSQSITVKAWIRQMWKNELMTWNASEWGVSLLRIDPSMLWYPDILLYNSADATFPGGTEKYKTQIMLYPDGLHYWLAPVSLTSTCKIAVTHFPFDRQHCHLKFGSWTNDDSTVNMLPDTKPIITSKYVNNSEWEILSESKARTALLYECCPNAYVDITFHLSLQRKPLYYVTNAIAPCVVLLAMITFSFFLPPESGERISLTITILLAVALFLQLVSGTLPKTSETVPRLASFYIAVMVESGLSLVTSCLVLTMHSRGNGTSVYPVSNWVRTLFLVKIATILSVKGRPKMLRNDDLRSRQDDLIYANRRPNESKLTNSMTGNGCFDNGRAPETGRVEQELKHINVNGKHQTGDSGVVECLKAINSEAKSITHTMREHQLTEEMLEEWRFLGKVLDRLFFWLFLAVSTVSSLTFLLPSYLYYLDS